MFTTPSGRMNNCSTADGGTASPASANGGQLSKKLSNAKHVSLDARHGDCKERQAPGHATARSQEPREHTLSADSTSNVAPRSHQRRWSADFCKCGTSPVITVKKNKKEPQPPHRGVSLLRPHATSYSSMKRYSCPAIGVFSSTGHPSSSSSSSSSSNSSCSSPPPVQTFVITGRDPLGWKLRPKSSSTSPRARTSRLSLQIPLPVIFPDSMSSPAHDSQPGYTANPDRSPKTTPPPRPELSRRRHSDSSAFLRSLATPLPLVTLEELCAVHLHSVTLSDEPDDIFSAGEAKVTTGLRKIPPPVPEKTSMTRQIAQAIAHSRQCCGPDTAKTNEENINTSQIKPGGTHSRDHHSLHARKTAALRVDSVCDRDRTTPRFPG